MKIDAAGIPRPDEPPEPIDQRCRCPDCRTPTWPGVDRDGHVIARRCVSCQVVHDTVIEEMHR